MIHIYVCVVIIAFGSEGGAESSADQAWGGAAAGLSAPTGPAGPGQ